jgi:hypothetical protein
MLKVGKKQPLQKLMCDAYSDSNQGIINRGEKEKKNSTGNE